MSQTIRHPEILDIARRDGLVTVEALAAHFGVTLQTIRRDLSDLAATGRLERVHGGAVLPSGVGNIGHEERRALNREAKARIGRACAAEVPERVSMFLGIGTTTEAVARALLHHHDLLVVTNNINVAQILGPAPGARIILTGGAYRVADGGLTGPQAAATVEAFRFDLAVIGCSALDPGGEMLDYDLDEVTVSRTALARARRRVMVADGSKLSRAAPVRIGTLAELDLVITDRPLPGVLSDHCRSWNTELRIAPA